MPDDPLDQLVAAFGSAGTPGLPASLISVERGVPYIAGGVRAPVTQFFAGGSLLLPPGVGMEPIDYAEMYLVLDDYFDPSGTGFTAEQLRDATIRQVLSEVGRDRLLLGLGFLTLAMPHP